MTSQICMLSKRIFINKLTTQYIADCNTSFINVNTTLMNVTSTFKWVCLN